MIFVFICHCVASKSKIILFHSLSRFHCGLSSEKKKKSGKGKRFKSSESASKYRHNNLKQNKTKKLNKQNQSSKHLHVK